MLINLTPHALHICNAEGEIIRTIEPTAPSARLAVKSVKLHEIEGIPVNQTHFGQVENLPEPVPGTYYIVSRVLADRVRLQRQDVLVPDDMVRDAEGKIVGCRAFAR